jgi:hypothetical protein
MATRRAPVASGNKRTAAAPETSTNQTSALDGNIVHDPLDAAREKAYLDCVTLKTRIRLLASGAATADNVEVKVAQALAPLIGNTTSEEAITQTILGKLNRLSAHSPEWHMLVSVMGSSSKQAIAHSLSQRMVDNSSISRILNGLVTSQESDTVLDKELAQSEADEDAGAGRDPMAARVPGTLAVRARSLYE